MLHQQWTLQGALQKQPLKRHYLLPCPIKTAQGKDVSNSLNSLTTVSGATLVPNRWVSGVRFRVFDSLQKYKIYQLPF